MVSRSVHTDPLDIRAARRLLDPYAARGAVYPRCRRCLAPRSEEDRCDVLPSDRAESAPRIVWHAPGNGYLHPAGPADIRRFLQQLPPRCHYKLRSVELWPAPPRHSHRVLPLGRMLLPGRVILYAQPYPTWMLGGQLPDGEQARLRQAGATVRVDQHSSLTVVTWPAHSLRDFMLTDVLLHELAHHVLQVRRAEPAVPVARTSDHEAAAGGLRRRQAARLAGQSREHA
jgi:hypothetical protein